MRNDFIIHFSEIPPQLSCLFFPSQLNFVYFCLFCRWVHYRHSCILSALAHRHEMCEKVCESECVIIYENPSLFSPPIPHILLYILLIIDKNEMLWCTGLTFKIRNYVMAKWSEIKNLRLYYIVHHVICSSLSPKGFKTHR